MSDSYPASDPIPDMTRLTLSPAPVHHGDMHDPRHETRPRSERRLSSSSSSSLPSRTPLSSQARNPQLHAVDDSSLLPLSSTPPPVPDRNRSSPASQEQSHHPQNPQGLLESSVPMDVWADQGHYPLFLDKVSELAIPVRGGTRLVLTGENFRDGIQVVFECPQLGDAVEAKVITPFVLQSTELEMLSPCFMDWWAHLISTTTLPPRGLDLTVKLICPGATLPSDMETPFGMVALEDSEKDLLQVIVGLHRQLIYASLSSKQDMEEQSNTRQRTLALLELDRPSSVTQSEHLALGVIYMLCDGKDRISSKGLELMTARSPGGHDMLHLSVVLGLSTLTREIARHLLNHYHSLLQGDITSIPPGVLAADANGLTALDFAVIMGHYEIEQVLIATLEAASEFNEAYLASLTARPLPTTPNSVVASRPLPPTPHGPTPEPTTHMDGGGPGMATSVSYFPTYPNNEQAYHPSVTAENTATTGHLPTSMPAQRIQTAHALILHEGALEATTPVSTAYTQMSHQSALVASPSLEATSRLHRHDQTYQSYQKQQQQQDYSQQEHAHPPLPSRANTEPLPPRQLPILEQYNNGHFDNHSDDLRQHHSYSNEPSPQEIYKSSVAPFRPLPATPVPPPAPLPPPKHIVKRVNRPKQFTIPAVGSEPGRSSSSGSINSGSSGSSTSPSLPLYPPTYRPQPLPQIQPPIYPPSLQQVSPPPLQSLYPPQQPQPHPHPQHFHSYPYQTHPYPPQQPPQQPPFPQPFMSQPIPQQHQAYPYPQQN
ncbi:hypothetical protein EMPS_04798 [Entomortierella parvispora]|uniref:IPT/TIG domain-containing protein n=1 Tax=Entomortierella parvispora TaxID=205924 RepID=A0A9P3H931_9FUNG|nr:hypothetical protein EMPS_04798 [Entomortierella parvispora]